MENGVYGKTGAYCFCFVPGGDLAEVVIWSCGQLELELKAEETVDVLHEIEKRVNLLLDL